MRMKSVHWRRKGNHGYPGGLQLQYLQQSPLKGHEVRRFYAFEGQRFLNLDCEVSQNAVGWQNSNYEVSQAHLPGLQAIEMQRLQWAGLQAIEMQRLQWAGLQAIEMQRLQWAGLQAIEMQRFQWADSWYC